ncbi:STAS domain-containing protein [Paragemmobacter straminiformis]|uniref:STAS domain-containing protein n=1 Tax=Paragemmobacter straminiformis TaxID=2045119 RepID=A0A842IBE5_9RHOB|nr:STAS domain-containing protein [Gemmobacter straminiformis]MBC2836733.1 STAS domain-containing protein [Gemmobacter straminiformis]
MPAPVPLDPRLTVESATALWGRLRGTGAAVLDGSAVRHFGAAALQVLLVARAEMGAGLVLQSPSDPLRAALADMGATDFLQGGDA